MEQLIGKQKVITGTVVTGGVRYRYEEYLDPNRPHYQRTIVIYRPGQDSVIFEYDTQKEAFQKVVEKIIQVNHKITK